MVCSSLLHWRDWDCLLIPRPIDNVITTVKLCVCELYLRKDIEDLISSQTVYLYPNNLCVAWDVPTVRHLVEIGLGEPQLFVASQRQVQPPLGQPPPGTGCSKYTLDTSVMLQLLCKTTLIKKLIWWHVSGSPQVTFYTRQVNKVKSPKMPFVVGNNDSFIFYIDM